MDKAKVRTKERILESYCPSMHDLYLDKQGRDFRDRVVLAMQTYADESLIEYKKTIEAQAKEIENLKSCMIAAAEEIMRVWPAHCDNEGYGPSNLMHRLEKGIPAQYEYKSGDFERLQDELNTERTVSKSLNAVKDHCAKEIEELKALIERNNKHHGW